MSADGIQPTQDERTETYMGTDADTRLGEDWLVRACRLVAMLLFGAAVAFWLRPITVPGSNFQPFGCGSPAAPMSDDLAKLVCTTDWLRVRLTVLALLVAGVAVLAVGEVLVARRRPRGFLRGAVLGGLVGIPVLVLGAVGAFTPSAIHGADGAVYRCGSGVSPATDNVMRSLCGQQASTSLYETVALAVLGLVLIAGAGYVNAARDSERAESALDAQPQKQVDGAPDPAGDGVVR